MVVQFSIVDKKGRKLIYKRNTRLNKFFRNAIEVTIDEYNKALNYFYETKARPMSNGQFLDWSRSQNKAVAS